MQESTKELGIVIAIGLTILGIITSIIIGINRSKALDGPELDHKARIIEACVKNDRVWAYNEDANDHECVKDPR